MENKYKARNVKKKLKNLPVGKVKIAVAAVIGLCILLLFQVASFNVDMHCTKYNNMCTISERSILDPTPTYLGKFDTLKILEIHVVEKHIENNKIVYDILLDYGKKAAPQHINYTFNTLIKANTVKLKLENYISSNAKSLTVTKKCYFNNYFCF